jgi:adenosylmethionine-8-amino-7-oxononanoate aminotransferase
MPTWLEKDKDYIWHPFTQHETEPEPIFVSRAKGASLFDENGREIVDCISSWWTCIHGHAHPAINKALCEQAEKMEHVMFAGFTHPPAIELSEKLAGLLPNDLNKVFFSDNGSTAVEVGLKLAYQYWKNKGEDQRRMFVAFDKAYHGDTFGAMAVGRACQFFTPFEDLMFEVASLLYPATWEDDEEQASKTKEAITTFKNYIDANNNTIAAVIIEPLMQGAGGIRFCPPAFVKEITLYAQSHGLPVIYDEVAVGFGRTGTLFAHEQVGAAPDIICLSKGLTAGYMPMSVTVASDRIFKVFLDKEFKKAFAHGHSFTANPLACAVALKSLELFDEEKTMENVGRIEKSHRAFLPRLASHQAATKARVLGTVLAFNLPDDEGYKNDVSEKMRDWFLSSGFNIRPLGSSVYLMPPFCISDAQLEATYAAIIEALDRFC